MLESPQIKSRLYKTKIIGQKIAERTGRIQYEDWKKHNLLELRERWNSYGCKKYEFEEFCKRIYTKLEDKQK